MRYGVEDGQIVAIDSEPDELDVLLKRIQDDVDALAAYCDSASWICFDGGRAFSSKADAIKGDTCPGCNGKRPQVRRVLSKYLGLTARDDLPWIKERVLEETVSC